MGLGKKAVIISMIAILMATFFVLLFSPRYERSLDQATTVTTTRVMAMNTYVTDLQTMTELLVQQMTPLALESLYNYTAEHQTALDSVVAAFESCILYDNFTNQDSVYDCVYVNEPLLTKLERITSIVDVGLHLTTNYTITNITIFQNYPFAVSINFTTNYTVFDNFTASWHGGQVRTINVNIIGLHDPLFGLHTGLVHNRTIRWTTIKDGQWRMNTSYFVQFYNATEYRINRFGAPSYLMRFEDNFSTSYCCGIETLLNTSMYSFDNMDNRSYIAYKYWEGTQEDCSEDIYTLDFPPFDSNYTLDRDHVAIYELWNVSSTLC